MNCQCCGYELISKKSKHSKRPVIIINLETGKSYKSCPRCSETHGSSHIYHLYPDNFKKRTLKNGKVIPQSWCTKCRSGKKTDPSKVYQEGLLCKALLSKETEASIKIIDLITNQPIEKEDLITNDLLPLKKDKKPAKKSILEFIFQVLQSTKHFIHNLFGNKTDGEQLYIDTKSYQGEKERQRELANVIEHLTQRFDTLAVQFGHTTESKSSNPSN